MRHGEGHNRFFGMHEGLWYGGDVESSAHSGSAICKRRNVPSESICDNSEDRLWALFGLLFLPGLCVGCCITFYWQRMKTLSRSGEQRVNTRMGEIQPQNAQQRFVQQNPQMQQNVQYLPNQQMQQNLQYLPNQQQSKGPPGQVHYAPRANPQQQEGVMHQGNQPTYTEGAKFSSDSSKVIKA